MLGIPLDPDPKLSFFLLLKKIFFYSFLSGMTVVLLVIPVLMKSVSSVFNEILYSLLYFILTIKERNQQQKVWIKNNRPVPAQYDDI